MRKLCCLLFTTLAFTYIGISQIIKFKQGTGKPVGPVFIQLDTLLSTNGDYELENIETGKRVVAQIDGDQLAFIPASNGKPGVEVSYRLIKRKRKASITTEVITSDSGILVKAGGRKVLFYRTTIAMPPPSMPEHYKRSGFIHPLYSPSGEILTDDFPAGHAHQHGIFLTWVNTTYKGKSVDFWNQHNLTGTVEHVKSFEVKDGAVFSQFKALLHHKSLSHGTILAETLTVKVYPFNSYFLFDLESVQTNITSDTLFLNKYHYGGLAFRGSRNWNADDSVHFKSNWQVLTSTGKRLDSANHTRAEWVKISGSINDKTSSATVFDHPKNFRYPQYIRVHPQMPYWCYAPMVEAPFSIAPGQVYRAKYRYLVQEGEGDMELIERVRKDFGF